MEALGEVSCEQRAWAGPDHTQCGSHSATDPCADLPLAEVSEGLPHDMAILCLLPSSELWTWCLTSLELLSSSVSGSTSTRFFP